MRRACQCGRGDAVGIIKDRIKPSDLAQLARAWNVLEDRKRILKGRPLPGSLKPVPAKPKRVRWGSMVPLDLLPEGEAEPMAEESPHGG